MNAKTLLLTPVELTEAIRLHLEKNRAPEVEGYRIARAVVYEEYTKVFLSPMERRGS